MYPTQITTPTPVYIAADMCNSSCLIGRAIHSGTVITGFANTLGTAIWGKTRPNHCMDTITTHSYNNGNFRNRDQYKQKCYCI